MSYFWLLGDLGFVGAAAKRHTTFPARKGMDLTRLRSTCAGGLSPNTEVSGGKVTKRTLQLGGKRNVKIPLMQVAKGYVIHPSDDPLWKRWKEYKERAGYGKALKWLARNVLEMAYYVWEHRYRAT